MRVQDGFIVGIFNYCDRWCEMCPFTSRCRVFADMASVPVGSVEGRTNPVLDAPPWMNRLVDGINKAAQRPLSLDECQRIIPRVAAEHQPIRVRADAYAQEVHAWMRARGFDSIRHRSDPRLIIHWYHTIIPPKIVRALKSLANRSVDQRDWPADHDGSAKVALLGIDRSHAAFLEVVDRGFASDADVQRFIAQLAWLREALERVFPNARAFVRPAFDEPDAVSRLLG